MKIRLLLFFISLFSLILHAQKDTICAPQCSKVLIGGSVQYGFLWSHRYNMGHLVKKHLPSYELDFIRISNSGEACQQPFHYPWTGVAVHVIPLGNPDELGTAIGVYPFINFPLGDRSHQLKLNMRFGWGLGYITNPFDPIENHKNVAIGSHLNACLTLRLNGILKINENNYMEFGLGMTHFSNGATKLPNLGLNIPMVNIGYHHSLFGNVCRKPTESFEKSQHQIFEILQDHHWHLSTYLVGGFNDIDPPGGNRFGLVNVQVDWMKQTARKARWGGGIDVMYSDAIRKRLSNDDIHVSVVENLQPGAKISYEFVVGRVSLPVELGIYIYSRYHGFSPVYNRFGVHYLVNEHLVINVSLKTHFARAEYFEYGLGWRF